MVFGMDLQFFHLKITMYCYEGRLHKREDAVVLCLLKIYNSTVIQSAVACSVARLVVMSPIGYFFEAAGGQKVGLRRPHGLTLGYLLNDWATRISATFRALLGGFFV